MRCDDDDKDEDEDNSDGNDDGDVDNDDGDDDDDDDGHEDDNDDDDDYNWIGQTGGFLSWTTERPKSTVYTLKSKTANISRLFLWDFPRSRNTSTSEHFICRYIVSL